ncbi:MAG: methyl-accepting chemotaxis protein [Actinomycetota bacterium]
MEFADGAPDPSARAATSGQDARALRIGRFAGWLFGVAGLLAVLWTVGTGAAWDWWIIAFLTICAGANVVPFAPIWEGRGELLAQLMVATACVAMPILAPFFLSDPVFLLLPALAAAYIGAAVDRRWLAGLVPFAIVLGVSLVQDDGVQAGVTEAITYLGLWLAIGSVAIWMRARVDEGTIELLDAEARRSAAADAEAERRAEEIQKAEAELASRTDVARALHTSIEAVSEASAGIEEQSTSIAAAVEEMATSLREAQSTASRTETSLGRISTATVGSQDSIARLDSAGQQIVGIVDTITDLSEQTNLLALNATIEAARAGETGKGFAVVANEVKDLAQRTAKSASEISSVVNDIQERLAASNEAIESISDLVTALEADQLALTAVVSQQSNAIEEISVSAATGAADLAEIGHAIRDLDRNASVLATD